ncbi:hypothetical protein IIA95_03195 [Patescibacteria group bacterium]|nr:hypothetical protein [Patescibacteria group bacterium]
MWNQTSKKFIGGFLGIIFLSLATLYITQTYFSPERQAERRLAELERQYAEDTYGGKTPEETLELFIDALKAGDIELASKYFVIDEQEEIKNDLMQVKQDTGLEQVISRIEKLKLTKKDSESAFFVIVDDKNIVQIQATLGKSGNGIWKIIKI